MYVTTIIDIININIIIKRKKKYDDQFSTHTHTKKNIRMNCEICHVEVINASNTCILYTNTHFHDGTFH